MKYLATASPVIYGHGHYSFEAISREEALRWFEEHHKTIKIGGFSKGSPPNQGPNQAQFAFVEVLARAVDRYVGNQQNNIGELTDDDEVLVVLRQQNRGGNPPVTIEELSFAFLKREKEHHAHHREHEHHEQREPVGV